MISLHDLRVSYGDREILHGVNMEVKRGETLVILGDPARERARCCARWWGLRSRVPERSG